MKNLLLGAAAAVALFATPALAQTAPSANCTGFEAAPALPNGAEATERQINAGNEAYQAWGQTRLNKLNACRADIDALRAQLNALEGAYNTANGELASVTQSWQASVAAYNERGQASNSTGRRERGSVNTRPDN